jgi:HD-like signal output (HDOD) protein/CheY-like chemotaxis protein
MALNEILFVDDDPDILAGLRNALRRNRARWNMRFALGGEAGLRELEAAPCDVIVTDMRMPGMDGLALLGQVRQHHPQAARLVLSGHADLDAVVRASSVAHQYLLKPCDTDTLCAAIDRALAIQALLINDQLRRVVGGLGTLPAAPAIYAALTAALADPDVDIRELAAIVTRDIGLAARMLQLVNSAYCGIAQRISSIETAITILGLNMVRHLALTVEVFRSFGGPDGAGFEELERHSSLTARIARKLAPDRRTADVAFAAGLLHDTGKLVLMRRASGAYRAAVELAARSGTSVFEAERASLGATHAEIGAYLLGLWDLPDAIIGPVAHHHTLEHIGAGGYDTTAAVALADRLAHEVAGDAPQELKAGAEVLCKLSALGDLPLWRETALAEARASA